MINDRTTLEAYKRVYYVVVVPFLVMQFVGRLISKQALEPQPGHHYSRIFIAQEVGYEVDITKIIIFEGNAMDQLKTIHVGSDIAVDAYRSAGVYKAKDIQVTDLDPCPQCLAPINNSQDCQGCKKEEQERITGLWKVKAVKPLKPEQWTDIKLILQQGDNILGFVTFPNTPFYATLSTLKEGAEVHLTGWRNKERHTKLSNVVLMFESDPETTRKRPPPLQLSKEECVECGKEFKNKNSLWSHRSHYHKKNIAE